MRFLIIVSAALVIGGCSSKGFNRGELKQQVGISKPVTTDADIAKALKKKPNLPKPFKIAIYFSEPEHYGTTMPKWLWTQEDKDLIFSATKSLQVQKIVSKVFPLVGSAVGSEDLKGLRLAAARHGADALLIISGISDIDRYANNWSWTYAFILPTFFVNGSQVDGLFVASATMWDVRNEFLYLTAETEGQASETYAPAFGKTDKEIASEAKQAALTDLKQQVVNMIKGQ